ncbi:MAG: hypothetical protein J6D87_04500 [Clostridia bacterium]|nr:hypothetical protein [Clostridia bacterium]
MNIYIENDGGSPKYFASANSSQGFINDFPKVFGDGSGVDRLYIIKGGPGTGKSYFMRKAAQYAEKQGYRVTYYHCSSDAASLDGVLMEGAGQPKIGILDGTAPHTWEVSLPGAREEIMDLGAFWDASALREEKTEITRLTCEKSKCYARAYRYLRACGEVTHAVEGQLFSCLHEASLTRYAQRLLRKTPARGTHQEASVRLRAVGMMGETYLDTFERLSREKGGEILWSEEYYGVGYVLMEKLLEISRNNGYQTLVSKHPIHPHRIDGLHWPDTGRSILVLPKEKQAGDSAAVSLRRYLDTDAFREIRGEVRHSLHMADELKACALRCLRQAGTYHFTLEKIYASSMNFQAKEAFENNFLERLFSPHKP